VKVFPAPWGWFMLAPGDQPGRLNPAARSTSPPAGSGRPGQRVGEREARVQVSDAVGPVDPARQIPQLAYEPAALVQQLFRVLRGLLAFLVAGHRGGPRLNLLQLLLLAGPFGQRLTR
jgi:hypothetical protein